jgi:integrase
MGWTLKDMQERLGHSDIKMTANIYSHLAIARKSNIAAALADKFGA